MKKVNRLAAAFARRLVETLNDNEMRSVIGRNRRETDAAICHSHDYCDANMIMDAAFKEITGHSSATKQWLNDDRAIKLWSDAWALAKEREFNAPLCEYETTFFHSGWTNAQTLLAGAFERVAPQERAARFATIQFHLYAERLKYSRQSIRS